MNTKTQIRKLLIAKKRLERKMNELDQKIQHVLFRLDEERRCMTRKCPLEDATEGPDRPLT